MILLKLQGFNAFFATDLFPYPLKTSENQMVLPDVTVRLIAMMTENIKTYDTQLN